MHPHEPENSSRVRLIEAAIACFAEKGFDAVGIREIAQRANANSALVQYHFGGKTGLYAEALKFIFQHRQPLLTPPPQSPLEPEARPRAMAAIGQLIEGLLNELMAHCEGTEEHKACHLLITREMQSPREDVSLLILEHMRPYTDHLLQSLRILRPDLDRLQAMDFCNSIFAQVSHLHSNIQLIRLLRGEPDYPQDLQAVVRHITEFSLRGIGIPEAFPGAQA